MAASVMLCFVLGGDDGVEVVRQSPMDRMQLDIGHDLDDLERLGIEGYS